MLKFLVLKCVLILFVHAQNSDNVSHCYLIQYIIKAKGCLGSSYLCVHIEYPNYSPNYGTFHINECKYAIHAEFYEQL